VEKEKIHKNLDAKTPEFNWKNRGFFVFFEAHFFVENEGDFLLV